MIQNSSERQRIQRTTRVLFRNKRDGEYLLTNDDGPAEDRLHIFTASRGGRISMEGPTLGAFLARNPRVLPELEEAECAFEELNPAYFHRDPVVDGFIGQAAGDAFGVPVEFMSREEVRELDLQDMVGSDCSLPFLSTWGGRIPSGAWSDDTSMTLAAMASIISRHGRIDYDDVMRQFLAWWEEGKYASLDFPFGLGRTVSDALRRYRDGVPALECGGKNVMDNGNGALMRIFPFSMYCIAHELSEDDTAGVIRRAAGITHGHEINALSCLIYTFFLDECVRTRNPRMAYGNAVLDHLEYFKSRFSGEAVLAHETLFTKLPQESFNPDSIMESGYVVDSLMTAIYCLLHTESYEDAVRMAVSFGYDTDTNAAITGSIAGATYGREEIPERWLNRLRKKETLMAVGSQFSRIIARPGQASASI